MNDIIDLDHRISVAIDRARGIRLSDEELDLQGSIGAIEVVKLAASAALKERAELRHAKGLSTRRWGSPAKQKTDSTRST